MKKTILWCFILLLPIVSFGQQKKKKKITGYLKFGAGLYWDISQAGPTYGFQGVIKPKPTILGPQIWIEGSIKLNDGLWITSGIMRTILERQYVDEIYHGQKFQYSIVNYSFGLGYEFNLGKHQKLMPQLAFVVNRRKTYTAAYQYSYDENGNPNSISLYIDENVDPEAGAVFNLDYYYQFDNKLFLGLRSGIYYVLGWEGITLTPVLGVKF